MSELHRVGLLGGTFDPPHLGHLVVAEEARVALELDEVWLVVAGEPWMKASTGASASQRVAMTELAVVDNDRLRVEDRETQRSGPTYTADTLEELHAEHPGCEWVFLLGEDAAADLPRWKRIDAAMELATFVVLTRPGAVLPSEPDWVVALERLDVTRVGISSTQLRRRFGAGGAVRYLVPPAVERYVRSHRLYGSSMGAG